MKNLFSDRLAFLRQRNNLTQVELSNMLEIPRSTYTNYEMGKRNPDFETLQKIADFYNVSTDFIIGRVATPYMYVTNEETGQLAIDFDKGDELEKYKIKIKNPVKPSSVAQTQKDKISDNKYYLNEELITGEENEELTNYLQYIRWKNRNKG